MGRRSNYKEEYCGEVHNLFIAAQYGLTDKSIAAYFNTSEQTINKWKKDYPNFLESLKHTKNELDQNVENSLYQRAIGYSHPEVHISNYQGTITKTDITKQYAPDPTSMIFWLKNRQRDKWRDVQETIVKQEVNETSDLEIARTVAFLLSRATQDPTVINPIESN